VGWSASIVSVFVLFLLIYRILPNAGQTWHGVVPGALVGSVLLLVLTQVFPLYVALFPPNHAYAFFGVFLVLTFWLYLMGMVLVLGVELNAFLEPSRLAAEALPAPTAAAQPELVDHGPVGEPQPVQARGGFGGRMVGLAGLIVAALLLRGEVKASDERATA
jgi:hypothetical protein